MCWWFTATIQYQLLEDLHSCHPLEHNSNGSCAVRPTMVKIQTGGLHPSLSPSPSQWQCIYAHTSRVVFSSRISTAMPAHQWHDFLWHKALHSTETKFVWSKTSRQKLVPSSRTRPHQLWFHPIKYWPLSLHQKWLHSCGLHQWLSHVCMRWYNHQ